MSSESDQLPDSGADSSSDKPWDHAAPFLIRCQRLAADAAACVRFFSRLPLSKPLNAFDDPAAIPDFRRIARAAPLAGLVVALPAAALGTALGYTHLPVLVVATLMIGLLAATTGALHEDGLSDLADGFFGGATRDRRLEIMKDSRIGAFGALALIVSVVLRVTLLAALWQRFSPADAALLFLSGEALSRALLVWQWRALPQARPDGLAARFGKPDAATLKGALLVTLPLLLPAFLLLSLPAFLLALSLAAVTAFAVGALARDKIGGVTGDVLGAIQQTSGLGFLAGMLMVP
ncbi:adenosylcobinamide-GDP ribazoletransferase [Roseibium sp.]|uniref:adenosylcobinamide-GDP ribazoletransferase n=1 Tax=Roseibium sp. TaxID=1936156 RepID=UPI003BAEDE04